MTGGRAFTPHVRQSDLVAVQFAVLLRVSMQLQAPECINLTDTALRLIEHVCAERTVFSFQSPPRGW